MQLAINTGSLAKNTHDALERAADLGFKSVEINLIDHEFAYGYRREPAVAFYRRLRVELDKSHLAVWSVSTPPLSQEQMFSERSRKEILKGGAGAAGIVGAKVFVVQPADIFINQQAFDRYLYDRTAPAVTEGFDEAWVQVVNRKMTMALANRDYWIGTLLTNQAERLGNIANDLAIGCALDIRQALSRNSLDTWLESIGERLAVAYAYDVSDDGLTHAPIDDDWEEWITILKMSRLKVLTIRAGHLQSDEEIVRSRRIIEQLLI
jgi:sugar phosphate isomerase/epimerase